jgi:hypothetical protein
VVPCCLSFEFFFFFAEPKFSILFMVWTDTVW